MKIGLSGLIRTGKLEEMYHEKRYDCGRAVIVTKYYPTPRKKGQESRARSQAEIKRWDQRKRAQTVQRLILANFEEGDYHLNLTYRQDERPRDLQEAKKRLSDFLTKVRKEYKKAGIAFKWIAVTEQGERGAYHHHLIIQNIHTAGVDTDKVIRKCWKWGRPVFVMMDDGNYEQLADYLVKTETKGEKSGQNMVHYSRSRNLIVPQPKIRKFYRRRWKPEPKAPKGFYLDKNSLVSGENPVTGQPWQRYILFRIIPKRRP